mmetsp:Transcript_31853/g.76079  ORF Transcript_31853/g.76079 Transcript_31853/m.76079 type:complete len:125 (+) Transcript_31853:462-836(+)
MVTCSSFIYLLDAGVFQQVRNGFQRSHMRLCDSRCDIHSFFSLMEAVGWVESCAVTVLPHSRLPEYLFGNSNSDRHIHSDIVPVVFQSDSPFTLRLNLTELWSDSSTAPRRVGHLSSINLMNFL